VATAAAKEVLCLPIFPEVTNEEHERVCGAVRELFGG
jgi:dTDP-4-amino-4,6-dideoxygalactose transaminase